MGFIQGLTEFIPVSSSAHLVLTQELLGLKDPSLLFDLILHLGTLIATLIIFYKEIWDLLRHPKAILLIIIAGIPTALMGFLLFNIFEEKFWNPQIACVGLLITGTFLWQTKKFPGDGDSSSLFSTISYGKALLIGIAQGIAIFPGISRSGATISAALFLKAGRRDAAVFSFLLSIPSIAGAIGLKVLKTPLEQIPNWNPYFIGFFASLILGAISLFVLMKIVLHGKFFKFSYYCWAIGILGLIYLNNQ